MTAPYAVTARTIHKTVGVDSKGVRHRVKPRASGNGTAGFVLTSVCDAVNWDTLDLKEGSPTCVRCMCLP